MKWLKSTPLIRHEYWMVNERPLLHVCSGNDGGFGDVTLDIEAPADIKGDATRLPFRNDSFAACFGDIPWTAVFKAKCADVIKEMLRVAPVAYVMSPWTYGSSGARITDLWVAHTPGVNQTLTLIRYERANGTLYLQEPRPAPSAFAAHWMDTVEKTINQNEGSKSEEV